jgi:O-antigen/teichoic acid export membrane protein
VGPRTVSERGRSAGFSERVVIVFAAQVVTAGIGIVNSLLFARLLGPEVKGDYYLLTLVPNTVLVLVQFGLPAALGFYSARGRTTAIVRRAISLAIFLSAVALLAVFMALPALESALLKGIDPTLIVVSMCVIPVLVVATFMSSIVIALRSVRWYAAVNIGQSVVSTILLVVLIGILGFQIEGAIATYMVAASFGMIGLAMGAVRAVRRVRLGLAVTYGELLRYGLPLYPASLTSFFSSRADVFMIAALVSDASASLGYYSMAVTLAEMATYLPSAVSSVFLPHVAGAAREDADRHVTTVARSTILLTGITAILLAPAGAILIAVVLPAFTPALPALYVLLPAVVSLAIARVVGEYVSGLGLTGRTSAATVLGFVVNLVANIILIPRYGIVGAAAASLISYTTSAVAITLIASRLSGAPMRAFWLPGRADVRFVAGTTASLLRAVAARRRATVPR